MGLIHSPRIVTDGLVLCLDAANTKGYDKFENLWTYSEQFNIWQKNNISITANQGIAPDGTLTADLVTTNTVSAYNTLDQFPTLSTNTNYCYSVFVKLVSGSGTSSRVVFASANNQVSPVYASWGLQLDTLAETSDGNTPTVKGYIPYPNGWYRLYMVINTSGQTNPSVGIRFGTGGADTVNTFYVWGAQLERGSSVTDYYPTTSTTKTRGTTWSDLSGEGNIGELVNSPTYNSSNLGYFQFVTDDYARIPNNTDLDTQTPSVEVWVKTNATSQNGFWFEKGTVNTQYSLFQEGSVIQWRQNIGGITNLSTTTATYMNTSNWYQVVGTYTSGTRRLYINGVQVNSDTRSGTIATNSGGMSIGAYGGYSGGKSYYYNGNLAICRVYNKVLTAEEIKQNFNALRSRFGI